MKIPPNIWTSLTVMTRCRRTVRVRVKRGVNIGELSAQSYPRSRRDEEWKSQRRAYKQTEKELKRRTESRIENSYRR